MAGRWSDDQERYWRDRDRELRGRYDDRYDVFGMNDCQHEPHGCSLTLMPRRASVRM